MPTTHSLLPGRRVGSPWPLTSASSSLKLLSWKVTNDFLSDKLVLSSPGICDHPTPDSVVLLWFFSLLNCGTSDVHKPWCNVLHRFPDSSPGFPPAFMFTFVSFAIAAASARYTSVLSRLFPGPLLHTVWAVFSEPVLKPLLICWWIQEWVQLRPFSWTPNPCEPASFWLFST